MRLYKHYFEKNDTPYRESFQSKKKYHTVWKRGKYRIFLLHKVVKIKFLGIFTIYKLKPEEYVKMDREIAAMKERLKSREVNNE
jgi:hypothetical protein